LPKTHKINSQDSILLFALLRDSPCPDDDPASRGNCPRTHLPEDPGNAVDFVSDFRNPEQARRIENFPQVNGIEE
jgi:hypothetical protein